MAVEALLEGGRFFAVKFSAKFEGAFLKFAPLEGYPPGQRTEIAGGMDPVLQAQRAEDHEQVVVVSQRFGQGVAAADHSGKFFRPKGLDQLQGVAERFGPLAPLVHKPGGG